jgi:hypothetical protein
VVNLNGNNAPLLSIQSSYIGHQIAVGIYDNNGELVGVSEIVMLGNRTVIDVTVKEVSREELNISHQAFSYPNYSSLTHSNDFDNDGDIDIAYTDGSRVGVFVNDGNGNFQDVMIASSIRNVGDIFSADMDNDGDIDIVTVTEDHWSNSSDAYTRWFENDGSLGFTEHEIYNFIDEGISSLFIKDINNDNYQDILVAGPWNSNLVGLLINNGDKSFSYSQVGSGSDMFGVGANDFDNDGIMDVVAYSRSDISWFKNDENKNFTKQDFIYKSSGSDNGGGVYTIDFDKDGDYDVLVANYTDNIFSWHENDGTGVFSTHILGTYGDRDYAPQDIYSSDIDGDGDNDIVGVTAKQIVVYVNDGNENFQTYEISNYASSPTDWDITSIHTADLDGDGMEEIIAGSQWYKIDISPLLEISKVIKLGEYVIGDPTYDVLVDGNYAYVTTSKELVILDISDKTSPSWVSSVSAGGGWSQGLQKIDNYLYVVGSSLQVFDVTDKQNPTLISSLSGGVDIEIDIEKKLAYVAYSSGIKVIDISDINSLSQVSTSTNSVSGITDIELSGDYLYASVVGSNEGLKIFDISDKNSPKLVGAYSTGRAYGVEVRGDYAYIADHDEGIYIVNVKDKTAPTLVSHYDMGHGAIGLYIQDKYLFISDHSSDLELVDISNPRNPKKVTESSSLGFGVWETYITNGFAYVTSIYRNNLTIFSLQ